MHFVPLNFFLDLTLSLTFFQGDILFLHMSKDPIRAGEIVVFNVDVRCISITYYFGNIANCSVFLIITLTQLLSNYNNPNLETTRKIQIYASSIFFIWSTSVCICIDLCGILYMIYEI